MQTFLHSSSEVEITRAICIAGKIKKKKQFKSKLPKILNRKIYHFMDILPFFMSVFIDFQLIFTNFALTKQEILICRI